MSVALSAGPESRKKRVTYCYDEETGNYFYSMNHPMQPHRLNLTYDLVEKHELVKQPNMNVVKPLQLSVKDICRFHTHDYIKHLRQPFRPQLNSKRDSYGLGGSDCPYFVGLYDFCKRCAGGSVGAAKLLNEGRTDIAINWSGGLHHARKKQAYGFCYVNDIVLAIQELLCYNERVLYVDIDVHHGDGVEEAFYHTNRVMTVSFHQYDGKTFFPLTGCVEDVGVCAGKNYAVNVPLSQGMDDESYLEGMFKPIMSKVMEVYQPSVVVLQCGADSLSGDAIGRFNLTTKGHSDCVRFMRSFNIPLMLLGGGGYTLSNVARCWSNETAVALGISELPTIEYHDGHPIEYFDGHPGKKRVKNLNTMASLNKTRDRVLQNLSRIQHAPSVPIHESPASLLSDETLEKMQDERMENGIVEPHACDNLCSCIHESKPDEPQTLFLESLYKSNPMY